MLVKRNYLRALAVLFTVSFQSTAMHLTTVSTSYYLDKYDVNGNPNPLFDNYDQFKRDHISKNHVISMKQLYYLSFTAKAKNFMNGIHKDDPSVIYHKFNNIYEKSSHEYGIMEISLNCMLKSVIGFAKTTNIKKRNSEFADFTFYAKNILYYLKAD
ncbi:MAG: hypothetical protein AAF320_05690, partial [Myxococcota bacterium]